MATSKAQQKAVDKYKDNHYDRVVFYLPKGEKEKLKQSAANQGISANEYIRKAIKAYMEEED